MSRVFIIIVLIFFSNFVYSHGDSLVNETIKLIVKNKGEKSGAEVKEIENNIIKLILWSKDTIVSYDKVDLVFFVLSYQKIASQGTRSRIMEYLNTEKVSDVNSVYLFPFLFCHYCGNYEDSLFVPIINKLKNRTNWAGVEFYNHNFYSKAIDKIAAMNFYNHRFFRVIINSHSRVKENYFNELKLLNNIK